MSRSLVLLCLALTAPPAHGQAVSGRGLGEEGRLLAAPPTTYSTRDLWLVNEPSAELTFNPLVATGQPDAQEGVEDGSSWKRGFVIGAVVGLAVGIASHQLLNAVPCDSCSGTGSDGAADGAGLEFAIGFALIGGGIGALIARF